MSRIFGVESGGKQLYREAEKKMQELIDPEQPGDFNQAVMEFGALQCTPTPNCSVCIFKNDCVAFNSGRVGDLPVKAKPIKTVSRYFHYFILRDKKRATFIVKRRSEGDIWKGLYDFPMIESTQDVSINELINHEEWKAWFSHPPEVLMDENLYKHQLTHQKLYARFCFVEFNSMSKIKMQSSWETISAEELKQLPVSRLIDRFMKKHPEVFE